MFVKLTLIDPGIKADLGRPVLLRSADVAAIVDVSALKPPACAHVSLRNGVAYLVLERAEDVAARVKGDSLASEPASRV